jgi:hypothetical protein
MRPGVPGKEASDRAESLGVLDGQSALIIAPTATRKSHIGREAIPRAIKRGDKGTHAHLVPYRAPPEEVYDDFAKLPKDTPARIRITTGDHRDPARLLFGPGHALVVPRRVIAAWFEASEEERRAIVDLVNEVKRGHARAETRPVHAAGPVETPAWLQSHQY